MRVQKFVVHWTRYNWTIGIILPHGGMIVWCLMLGPLTIQFWPRSTWNDDAEPFGR